MALYADGTKVPISQTRMEIERLLEKHHAKQYGTAVDYETRQARVQFRIHERIVRFVIALPDPKKFKSPEKLSQAERQKWRALLLVIKAKLESVENFIATFEEEFLAHIVMPNDLTVGQIVVPQISQAYKDGKMPKALSPAPEEKK